MLGLSNAPVPDELLGLDRALTIDHPLSTVRSVPRFYNALRKHW